MYKALDSRSKGPIAGYVWTYQANFSFYDTFVQPAVMGTWWNKKCRIVVIGSCRRNVRNSVEENILPKGEKTVKECVPIPGVQLHCPLSSREHLDYKHVDLHLFTLKIVYQLELCFVFSVCHSIILNYNIGQERSK